SARTPLDGRDRLERRFETFGPLVAAERTHPGKWDPGFLEAADRRTHLLFIADARKLIQCRLADIAGLELGLEPAGVHHLSVVRKPRIASHGLPKHVLARGPVRGQADWHRRHDLETVERLAPLFASGGNGRHDVV